MSNTTKILSELTDLRTTAMSAQRLVNETIQKATKLEEKLSKELGIIQSPSPRKGRFVKKVNMAVDRRNKFLVKRELI